MKKVPCARSRPSLIVHGSLRDAERGGDLGRPQAVPPAHQGDPPRPTFMSSDFGFPGEPGQVPPVRPGRPARWRVHRADSAHGAVTATAKCTSEDGTVWDDVEVPISQDYEDGDGTSG
jgi:hypothetical protein